MKARTLAILLALALLRPAAAHAGQTRFLPLDLFVETGGRPLAAWQAEITYPSGRVSIVGVEGTTAPFADAPYFDPKGLTAGRLIIAAFTTEPHPPAGRLHVARIHLSTEGEGPLGVTARLVLAAGPDGQGFPAEIELLNEKGAQP